MVRISTTLLAVALFAGFAPPAPAQYAPSPYGPAATPAPRGSTDPTLLARAKSVFAQLQTGKVDRSELAANGPNGNMTDATLSNAQKMIGSLGAPVSFVQQQASSQGSVHAAIYVVTFKNGEKVDFLFAVDSQGKVEGMSLGTPH